MKRTPTFEVGTGAFELNIFTDHLGDIQPIFDILGVGHIHCHSERAFAGDACPPLAGGIPLAGIHFLSLTLHKIRGIDKSKKCQIKT